VHDLRSENSLNNSSNGQLSPKAIMAQVLLFKQRKTYNDGFGRLQNYYGGVPHVIILAPAGINKLTTGHILL